MSASIWAPGTDVISVDAENTLTSEALTATNGQTVFNLTVFTYVPGSESLAVFRNGQKLIRGTDFSETSSTSFTLTVSPAVVAGEVIEAVGLIGSSNANAQAAAASAAAALASEQAAAAIVAGLPSAANIVEKDSSTGAAHIPAGTTAQRPGSPVYGDTRANSDLTSMEWWNGTAWVPMGGGATGGTGNAAFFENDQTITANYTLTANKNAMSAGPITVNNGVTVTVPNGAVWTVV